MSAVVLIFPHQLFKDHPCLDKASDVYLVEEFLYFRQYNFHVKKLVLHRAGMKYYQELLEKTGRHKVHYIETNDSEADVRNLVQKLSELKVRKIYVAELSDNWLEKRLRNACKKYDIEIEVSDTPGFITKSEEARNYVAESKRYHHADFYIWQRKKRKILVNEKGAPEGGKWSFDTENRKRFPKSATPPPVPLMDNNKFLKEATVYIQKHFPKNYGSLKGLNLFAVTHKDAEELLQNFLYYRFAEFGHYEDAIVARQHVLHHSVLTPMLNTGLLEPAQVVNSILQFSRDNKIPLNSVEGFIRQVIGWREYIHIVYRNEGSKQRTKNFWNFSRPIPEAFWKAETGIEPVDNTIRKILDTGYCHHIERLMVLGNFMLLCEFNPDDVYRWFMELFIDAYDWVMVPNVYGMSQFADGGLMSTKPYISGSNYILKMSDYKKGEWQEIWDALFWRFIHVHRDFFSHNPRLNLMTVQFDKMDAAKRKQMLNVATKYLDQLGKIR